MDTISIKIDKKEVKAQENQTILEVAKANNIEIPTLCFHPDLSIKASCRVCVVEIIGQKDLFTACSTKISEGMEIITDSETIQKARQTNLELLFSQHREECNDCVWLYNCRFLQLAKQFKVDITRFKDRKTNYPVYDFGNALQFDSSKCIDCRNCIEACNLQEVRYLELQERDNFLEVMPSKNRQCIYCGQCLTHCPVGAFEAKGEFEEIEKPLKKSGKIIIFQIAPAIRTSIGEEFGMPPGTITTDQITAGIKKLGANKVFDISVGADFTTTEESKELTEKITNGKNNLLFSSCCPSWVRYVELYYPEFLPNIATSRPPHIILGGLIKTYWAQEQGINPKDLFVVSVMPCVAKKYEITRPEMQIKMTSRISDTSNFLAAIQPVDYVMTSRELSRLFLKNQIDLKTIQPEELDSPFNKPSGAGIIYGASGGVMESALRNALFMVNKTIPKELEFKTVRGQQGIKTLKIEFQGKEVNVAVASGTGNAKKIMERLKEKPDLYNCVEIMACPGGCIGGGGQPLPVNSFIRAERSAGLYKIDSSEPIQNAQSNPIVQKVYDSFLNNQEAIRKICHTSYKN